jgi:hypothetical protein
VVAAVVTPVFAVTEILLPRDARALVEAATHPDSLDRFADRGPAWRIARNHGMGAEHASRRLAEVSVVDTSQDYADQPTDPEEHIATRLGDAPVTVITPDFLSPFTSDQIECLPPLGYEVADRKLIVNEAELETVRHVYRRYLELGSVRRRIAIARCC